MLSVLCMFLFCFALFCFVLFCFVLFCYVLRMFCLSCFVAVTLVNLPLVGALVFLLCAPFLLALLLTDLLFLISCRARGHRAAQRVPRRLDRSRARGRAARRRVAA